MKVTSEYEKETTSTTRFSREEFLQDVYLLLHSVAPKGLLYLQISRKIKRSDYENPPRFVDLPAEEPQSFRVEKSMMYAVLTSPRATAGYGQQAESSSLLAGLQTTSLTSMLSKLS